MELLKEFTTISESLRLREEIFSIMEDNAPLFEDFDWEAPDTTGMEVDKDSVKSSGHHEKTAKDVDKKAKAGDAILIFKEKGSQPVPALIKDVVNGVASIVDKAGKAIGKIDINKLVISTQHIFDFTIDKIEKALGINTGRDSDEVIKTFAYNHSM